MSSASPPSWTHGASALSALSEKGASSHISPASSRPAESTSAFKKPRSCVTCRKRKVRCDKTSPCSNCRRAKIPCVVPSQDQPPRWARKLDRVTLRLEGEDPGVDQVFNRLRSLEELVKQLSGQLDQAQASKRASSEPMQVRDGDVDAASSSSSNVLKAQNQFGRLVISEQGRSRYVDSGFWSRINDELNGLKMDTEKLTGEDDISSDEADLLSKSTPSTHELHRDPSDRNAFMFSHTMHSHTAELANFHPLPSQVPFILNLFHERINSMGQAVHMPTLHKTIQGLPSGDLSALSPSDQTLMFAIYYASITSMEDEDVAVSFRSSKTDLVQRYRHGFELALSKTDFLNNPNIVLVQALEIFLLLARRHDSPRYVWMMTGLVIRMAQALGLHRDGSNFTRLTPFEVEIRRRLWWILIIMDLRSSEDQGMDLTIIDGSFDTKYPLNINDEDIHPNAQTVPSERKGLTDMTVARTWYTQVNDMRQMYGILINGSETQNLEKQSQLLEKLSCSIEETDLRAYDSVGNIRYWMFVAVTRLVVSKMTLVVYLPELFSSPKEQFSDALSRKLLIAAIEVAEFNHMLNSSQACRPWRWIFQTYAHWHSIVYLLLTIAQQPLSPTVERAWIALHSAWLIPSQGTKDEDQRTWLPLKKLMAKARRHRDAEIQRLRLNPLAARELETGDEKLPQPVSSGLFQGSSDEAVEIFRQSWRQTLQPELTDPVDGTSRSSQGDNSIPIDFNSFSSLRPKTDFSHASVEYDVVGRPSSTSSATMNAADAGLNSTISWKPEPTATPLCLASTNRAGDQPLEPGFSAWQWSEVDMTDFTADFDTAGVNLDVCIDGDMDWNKWLLDMR